MSTVRKYFDVLVRWVKRQCLIVFYVFMGVEPIQAIADHEQFQRDVEAAPDLFREAIRTRDLNRRLWQSRN